MTGSAMRKKEREDTEIQDDRSNHINIEDE